MRISNEVEPVLERTQISFTVFAYDTSTKISLGSLDKNEVRTLVKDLERFIKVLKERVEK